MRRSALVLACLLVAAFSLSACGDKTVTSTDTSGNVSTRTVPDVKFAKTKFVLHTGLAIGAFKRYIATPFANGEFKKGSPKRKRTIAKAVAAGAFVAHELKQARDAALSDDKLRGIGDKLGSVGDQLKGLLPSLATGALSGGSVSSILGGLGGISSAAGALGLPIKERSPTL